MIPENRSRLVGGGNGALGRLQARRTPAGDPACARWLTLSPGDSPRRHPGKVPPATEVDPSGDEVLDLEATASLHRPPPGGATLAQDRKLLA